MRTPLVAANWKMNLTSAEGAALVEQFAKDADIRYDLDVVVCPPYLSIPKVREHTRVSTIKLGAQDCFWEEKGAFTGQVSAAQLSEFCVDFCIVGHSETRGRFGKLETNESTLSYFNESEETINLKIKSLLYHGITPILCVGETKAERTVEQTRPTIRRQLEGALAGIDGAELYTFVVAYEPVWAIGTGDTCEPEEAESICAFIRATLAEIADEDVAAHVRILYGGSVKPDNAASLFQQPNIDGGLVGGASLDAKDFAQIVAHA